MTFSFFYSEMKSLHKTTRQAEHTDIHSVFYSTTESARASDAYLEKLSTRSVQKLVPFSFSFIRNITGLYIQAPVGLSVVKIPPRSNTVHDDSPYVD